jgi:putative transposase
MVQLRHYDNTGLVRFVTFNCYRNQPSLSDNLARTILIECLDAARRKHGFRLYGYVIMPEHVHLVLHPAGERSLGLLVREIKSLSARKWFALRPVGRAGDARVFWQKRCYDHNCRTPEDALEKIAYCHNNPVRRGLVADPAEWRWSSHNWFQGVRDVPLAMDAMV